MGDPLPSGNITVKRRRIAREAPKDFEDDVPQIDDDAFYKRNTDDQNQKRLTLHKERKARDREIQAKAKKLNDARKNSQDQDAVVQSSIVSELLSAHMSTKIAIANCFDQRTVLDIIDKSCVERETMQDMAVAIDTASMVYGYRVDKTHLDAQDTRFTFIKGKPDEGGSASCSQADADSNHDEVKNKPKRKKATVVQDEDWQNRYQGLMAGGEERISLEREENDDNAEDDSEAEAFGEDDDAEDGENDTEDSSNENENEMITIRDNIDHRLLKIKEQRKKHACRIKARNRMLEEDDDRLCMVSTELSENDYYQKAVSRHGEGTANSLLMLNARCSGDGRVLFMHSRVTNDPPPPVFDDEINTAYLNGVRATLCNALTKNSIRPENDLLPKKDNDAQSLFLRSGKIDGHQSQYLLGLESDEEEGEDVMDGGNDPDSTISALEQMDQTEVPENTMMMDTTEMLEDRTILESTMMPNTTIMPASTTPTTAAEKTKKNNGRLLRMQNRNIADMWIPDYIDLFPAGPIDTSQMRRILNTIYANNLPVRKEGIHSHELAIPVGELYEAIQFAQNSGFDDDFRDVDYLWNSTVVKKVITDDDSDRMLRRAEREGVTSDDVLARKRRVLPPGEYIFFMERTGYGCRVPADPYAAERASVPMPMMDMSVRLESRAEMDDYANNAGFVDASDSFDFGGNGNDDMDFDAGGGGVDGLFVDNGAQPTDSTTSNMTKEDDRVMRDILGNINRDDDADTESSAAAQLSAPCDDVADVPATEAVAVNPQIALRSMGKLDDAHWKVNQTQPEKKERAKKEKQIKEEKSEELYFIMDDADDRNDAIHRFKLAKPSTLEKSEDALFTKKRSTERRPHLAYKFDNFTKPALLFKGKYGGVRFERTMATSSSDEQFNRFVATAAQAVVDKDDSTDDVCREWLGTFGGFRVMPDGELGSDGGGGVDDGNDSFHSAADSMEDDIGGGHNDMMDDYEVGTNVDSDIAILDMDGEDTFHSATQVPVDAPPVRRNLTRHDALMHELQELQGDDEDEDDEEGEQVQMLDKKVTIKNTSVDQSRVKWTMKNILINKLMGMRYLRRVAKAVLPEKRSSTAMSDEHREEMEVASTSSKSSEKENACHLDTANAANKTNEVSDEECEYDPVEITRAVFAPQSEPSQSELHRSVRRARTSVVRPAATGGDQVAVSQEANESTSSQADDLSSGVILGDFDVDGHHSMASVFSCLPFRATRPTEKAMHIAYIFSLTLHLCNENTLHMEQQRQGECTGKNEDWMGDCVIRNASPQPITAFSQRDNLPEE